VCKSFGTEIDTDLTMLIVCPFPWNVGTLSNPAVKLSGRNTIRLR